MKKVRLDDICMKQSSNFAQKDLNDLEGIYPVYGASGFLKNIDVYHQEKAYVAVVKDGAGVGRTMHLPAKSSIIGTLQYLIPKEGVDAKYLYYAVKSRHLEKYYTGATIPHIYFKDYKNEMVTWYEVEEQKKIIAVLERVETIIKLRKRQIEQLDEVIKVRFVELFGDVICNNKEWEVRTFSEIATSRLGKMLDAKQQTGQYSYPYLANFNVQWFRFEIENLNQMDFDESDRIEFELKDGDLLVCEGGEIGRCAVWHNEIQPCFFQKALHRVRCDRHVIHPDYLAWWFKYNCDNGGLASIAGAKATIAHLPGVKLKQLQVATPPIELQQQFVIFVSQTEKLKVTVQKTLDETKRLFDSLMQKYFG